MKKPKDETSEHKELTKPSPVEPGCIGFQLTQDELTTLIEVLKYCRTSSEFLAQVAAKEAKADEQAIFLARANVSRILQEKFTTINEIGEPYSREYH